LRGVYYRCVSAGAIPKTENGYRAIGRRLLELRRGGRVGYSDITDGTRWVRRPRSYDDINEALLDAASSYRRSLWSRSMYRVMVFTEKDAITGVIEPITMRWDVPLGVMRGYVSESFAWKVAKSLDDDYTNVIVQLGDHDPSGVGAWDDFAGKIRSFTGPIWSAREIEFVRLAVTPEQIDAYDLPTRPTKQSDTRARHWQGGSVEVDAIPAPELRDLLDRFLGDFHDQDELDRLGTIEAAERESVYDIMDALEGWES
jgi:hypothetical protein